MTANATIRRFTAKPDGLAASFMLAMLATAGFFYVNIMPAIVNGLSAGAGLSQAEAGSVGSANIYGAAFGALAAVFMVPRINWRPVAAFILTALVAIDLASTLVTNAALLTGMRAVHGIAGGALVGLTYGVIARTGAADRTFGVLLVVQFGLGGLGNMYLPGLVPEYGTAILFYSLAAFSLVALLMLPFLAPYPVVAKNKETAAAGKTRWMPLVLTLAAIFLFQAGNMALAAYIIDLGAHYQLSLDAVTDVLGPATWIGISGALAVVFIGTRWGRTLPLLISLLITVGGNYAFHWSGNWDVFFAANCVTSVSWAFVIPYLFGVCAAFDASGQKAALGGFFSKMGLASGPLAAGFLVEQSGYPFLIDMAVLALALSSICALIPARMLDRSKQPA